MAPSVLQQILEAPNRGARPLAGRGDRGTVHGDGREVSLPTRRKVPVQALLRCSDAYFHFCFVP